MPILTAMSCPRTKVFSLPTVMCPGLKSGGYINEF